MTVVACPTAYGADTAFPALPPAVGYGAAMDFEVSTPLGIALVVIGIFVAIKAAKTVVKIVMLLVIAAGLYLWFGAGGDVNPFA